MPGDPASAKMAVKDHSPAERLLPLLPPLAVFLGAFTLRFLYIHQFKGDPFLDCLFLDPAYYHNQAMRIAGGEILGGSEVFEMSPLYSYFLAFFYKYITTDLFTIRLVQILIGSLSCVLIYFIARRVFGGTVPALVAGLAAAAYGPFILYDGVIMKTSLTVFFVLLMTLSLMRSEVPGAVFPPLLAGLFLGLAALVRENIVLLVPIVPLWFMGFGLESKGTRILKGVIFVLGAVIIILPITLRNFYVGGEPVLITSGGGEVFYIGNNPEADGTYRVPSYVTPTPASEHEDFRRKARELTGRELTRGESSRYWFLRGFEYIIENQIDYAVLEAKKLFLFWNFYEYPDNHNYYLHRTHSRVLGGPVLGFGIIAPLALLGLFLSFGQPRKFAVVYLVFFTYLVSFLMFFNYARFRIPAVPFMIIFGVYALYWIAGRVRARSLVPVFLSISALAVFFMAVNTKVHGQDPYRFLFDTSYTNLGLCYEDAGDDDRALDYMNGALEINPRKVLALKAMGRIHLKQSRYGPAERAYMKILETRPDYAPAHHGLTRVYRATGEKEKWAESRRNYEKWR
ncbi:MAG: glycosyltransferase family 39 protein [Thermodesulfobacteriota bacterium]